MTKTVAITWKRPDTAEKLPPGPWQDEPDKAQWYDPATGMACLIVRNRVGGLCGYVGVESDHPWHGKDYGACIGGPDCSCQSEEDDYSWCDNRIDGAIGVHGGLTFSDSCADVPEGGDQADYVCHVPGKGRPDDVWWFGFDCVHLGDLAPGMLMLTPARHDNETYRDMAYVRAEVAKLAEQLAAVA